MDDNYEFLARDGESGATASIDTPEAGAINAALAEKGWQLASILNIHHHFDHIDGNEALEKQWDCQIVGAAKDAHWIPGIDQQVADGDAMKSSEAQVHVLEVPGHTLAHIACDFEDDQTAFMGNTLFALGCGRRFEGSAERMWHNLEKSMKLPDNTAVYCAHQYTQANAAFAITIEPDNAALQDRVQEMARLRAQGIPTVPSSIGLERKTHPFVRPTSSNSQATVNLVGAKPLAIFAEMRKREDHF